MIITSGNLKLSKYIVNKLTSQIDMILAHVNEYYAFFLNQLLNRKYDCSSKSAMRRYPIRF